METVTEQVKHTPGPWYVFATPTGGIGIGDKMPPAYGGKTICLLSNDFPFEANANLIAAAPEMLEALKLATKIIGKVAKWHGTDLAELDDEFGYFSIEHAIDKAEGRA